MSEHTNPNMILHDGYHECISGEMYILYGNPPDPFVRVISSFLSDSDLPYSRDITTDFLQTYPNWRETFPCTWCSPKK
jgi:hypothetical protein